MPLSHKQITALERLSTLRSIGAVTEAEFAELKSKIMNESESNEPVGTKVAAYRTTQMPLVESKRQLEPIHVQKVGNQWVINRPINLVKSAVVTGIETCGLKVEAQENPVLIRTVGGTWKFNGTGLAVALGERGTTTILKYETFYTSGGLQSTRKISETVLTSIENVLRSMPSLSSRSGDDWRPAFDAKVERYWRGKPKGYSEVPDELVHLAAEFVVQRGLATPAMLERVLDITEDQYSVIRQQLEDFSVISPDGRVMVRTLIELHRQMDGENLNDDALLKRAMGLVVLSHVGSTSVFQRKLGIGFATAGRLMDELEERGIVGPPNGSKARDVFMTIEEYETYDTE